MNNRSIDNDAASKLSLPGSEDVKQAVTCDRFLAVIASARDLDAWANSRNATTKDMASLLGGSITREPGTP
jgi:hypothetical protein